MFGPFARGGVEKHHHGSDDLLLFDDRKRRVLHRKIRPVLAPVHFVIHLAPFSALERLLNTAGRTGVCGATREGIMDALMHILAEELVREIAQHARCS